MGRDIRSRLTKMSREENKAKVCDKVMAFYEDSSEKNLETSIDVEILPSTQKYCWDSDEENISETLQKGVEREEVETETSDDDSAIEYTDDVDDDVKSKMGFTALGTTNKIYSATSGGTKKTAKWEEECKKLAAERSKNEPERPSRKNHDRKESGREERSRSGRDERSRRGREGERHDERRREGREQRRSTKEEDKKDQERKEAARYY